MNKKMEFNTMGDDELEALFENCFSEQVANKCNVQEFSCRLLRGVNSNSIEFGVEITGLAGTPTMDDFKNNKIKDARKFVVNRPDKGDLPLHLVPSKTAFLTGNDFLIVYSN